MGLADLNQLIEHSIEEVSALFLERGAQPGPVLGKAIGQRFFESMLVSFYRGYYKSHRFYLNSRLTDLGSR